MSRSYSTQTPSTASSLLSDFQPTALKSSYGPHTHTLTQLLFKQQQFSQMAEAEGAPKVTAPPRPTITLPPRRTSFETLFAGGHGLSPGPMTLVSNFFSDHYPDSDCRSFSQLLAGAMASPVASLAAAKPADNSGKFSSTEATTGDGSEKNFGFRQNRPVNLVVAPHSPMFMVPPGLTPSGLLNSPGFFSPVQSPFGMSHQQALAHVTAQAALSQSYMQLQAEYQPSTSTSAEESAQHQSFVPSTTAPEMHTLVSDQQGSTMESSQVLHSDKKHLPASLAADKPVNDGYNWRKYGQKQVKASEYPRSYYRCTNLNCPVKKKVERSVDGQISEITYKGQHNHEPPQHPNKRSKEGGDRGGTMNSRAKPELGQRETSMSDEDVPSNSVPEDVQIEPLGSIEHDETNDSETRIGDEGDEDEPNPKRRNTEVGASHLASSQKVLADSRIIVQTRSEVDLLDDGYKWRKYGQKVVKGNPYPRSYYKCTYAGCNVRKHVERSSADPKAVVTSYEGKHNHDVPLGRNTIHNAAGNNTHQLKPQKVVARKPALHKEMDFGRDQLQVVLQFKEEQITA